jgi:hypothetical protein
MGPRNFVDSGPILGDGKNFFAPRIPRKDAVEGIILPRPWLAASRVDCKRFLLAQGVLLDCSAHPGNKR